MRDIPGTHRTTFEVVFNGNFFEKGDVLSSIDGNTEVMGRSRYKEGRITLCAELGGEELEIAIQHYNFLRKYNLV